MHRVCVWMGSDYLVRNGGNCVWLVLSERNDDTSRIIPFAHPNPSTVGSVRDFRDITFWYE